MCVAKLKEFLESIEKCDCLSACELRPNKAVAWVPPPNEILGIIISRDPTNRWQHFYTCVKLYKNEDICRKMLFASAIPYSLFIRIIEFMDFMGKSITVEERKCLFDVIFEKVYWTHLHKCFTNASDKKSKFKSKNAEICANKWLKEELNSAISDETKFVIALGKDVKKWVDNWWKEETGYIMNKNVEIIYLPHPSPANVGKGCSWCPKREEDKRRIEEEIKKLINFCKSF